MNDSPEYTHNPGTQPGSPGGGFFAWIRGLGISRSSDRWFTGVAGGIAAKAGVDPLIIRGVFVVLTVLGGSGIFLYAIGWLFLPDREARIHAEEIIRGRAATWVIVTAVIVASVLVIPFVFGITGIGVDPFTGGWGWAPWGVPDWIDVMFTVLWWIAIIGGGIWLLVWALGRDRNADRQTGTRETQASASAPFSVDSRGTTSHATAERDAGNETPPQNAHPATAFATVPETSRSAGSATETWRREATGPGAGHTIVSIALALLAGGAAALWAIGGAAWGRPVSSTESEHVLTFGLIAAVALLALSMIVAGVRGRTPGWVGFFAAAGVVSLLITAVLPSGARLQPFGDAVVSCCETGSQASISEGGTVVLAGSVHLDLGNLDAARQPAAYEVWLAAGNVRVDLPQDHPTVVNVHLMAGNIREYRAAGMSNETQQSGPFLSRTFTTNLEPADADDVTRIDVRVMGGNVHVHEPDSDTALSDTRVTTDERTSRDLEGIAQ